MALHVANGKVSSADIVRAICEIRGKGVDLVVWDLRKTDFSLVATKLESTIKVTFPTQRHVPSVVFLVADRPTTRFLHDVLTRTVPPWPWRISTDPIEAERLVAQVLAPFDVPRQRYK